MDMKQLQSFTAVVKYRSFTKAAERPYLSQPTISTPLPNPEGGPGPCLIIRTKRSGGGAPRGTKAIQKAEGKTVPRAGKGSFPGAPPEARPADRPRHGAGTVGAAAPPA